MKKFLFLFLIVLLVICPIFSDENKIGKKTKDVINITINNTIETKKVPAEKTKEEVKFELAIKEEDFSKKASRMCISGIIFGLGTGIFATIVFDYLNGGDLYKRIADLKK